MIAVFEKAGWYKMDTIKRHVVSKRHKKATASYTVKITGPDFTIKTERNAKSSWNKWNISSTKFENSLSEFLFEFWPFLSVFLSNQSDLGSVKLNHILHSYWNSVYLKSSILKSKFRANLTGDTLFLQNWIQRVSNYIFSRLPMWSERFLKNLMNLKLGVIFNLGSLYCYSCQMIVSAVFKASAKH